MSYMPWLAGANAACYFISAESPRWFDAPAAAAQLLKISSYAGLLGTTLIDNVRLFGQVSDRAISDSSDARDGASSIASLLAGR